MHAGYKLAMGRAHVPVLHRRRGRILQRSIGEPLLALTCSPLRQASGRSCVCTIDCAMYTIVIINDCTYNIIYMSYINLPHRAQPIQPAAAAAHQTKRPTPNTKPPNHQTTKPQSHQAKTSHESTCLRSRCLDAVCM